MSGKWKPSLGAIGLIGIGHVILVSWAGEAVVLNPGLSFGWKIPFLELGVLIALLSISFGFKEISQGREWIIGGGVVNFIDRLMDGMVSDYWYWPLFDFYNNLPDMAIFVGTMIVLSKLWRRKLK